MKHNKTAQRDNRLCSSGSSSSRNRKHLTMRTGIGRRIKTESRIWSNVSLKKIVSERYFLRRIWKRMLFSKWIHRHRRSGPMLSTKITGNGRRRRVIFVVPTGIRHIQVRIIGIGQLIRRKKRRSYWSKIFWKKIDVIAYCRLITWNRIWRSMSSHLPHRNPVSTSQTTSIGLGTASEIRISSSHDHTLIVIEMSNLSR